MFRIKNEESKIGGVCVGLAKYFEIELIYVRIAFILAFFTPIPSFIIYVILWIFLPEISENQLNTQNISNNKSNFTMSNQSKNGNLVGGLILIVLGVIFSFKTFFDINLFSYIHNLWPIILIGLGVWLILKENDHNKTNSGGDQKSIDNQTNY